MADHPSSSFGKCVEWLGRKIAIIGAISISLALISLPLGFSHSTPLYIAAGIMFLIAQLFIVRWMFGIGRRTTKQLGFESNRQAIKYSITAKGLDLRLSAVAIYGAVASLILGYLGMGQFVSGAMLLSFATFGAVTQAMRLNRSWPVDPNS